MYILYNKDIKPIEFIDNTTEHGDFWVVKATDSQTSSSIIYTSMTSGFYIGHGFLSKELSSSEFNLALKTVTEDFKKRVKHTKRKLF